jgi:hypothetical protein
MHLLKNNNNNNIIKIESALPGYKRDDVSND